MDNSSEEESVEDISSDIDFELINPVKKERGVYTIQKLSPLLNQKKLLCFSLINNIVCGYNEKCSYAHSLKDQVIDPERKFIYQLILNKSVTLTPKYLNSFPSSSIEIIYKQFSFMSYLCKKCKHNKCTGGYNCKNGALCKELKICKNDVLTGECNNEKIEIHVDMDIISKIMNNKTDLNPYIGCINGHHLTERKLVPYYKYIHQQENVPKNVFQSVRYIKTNQVSFNLGYKNDTSFQSDETTDDELNSWFKKSSDSELSFEL